MKDKMKEMDKKKLLFIGIAFISIIIILCAGALLYNKLFSKKSYSQVENIMINAAIEYYEDNLEKLPKNINDSITITDTSLVKFKKMNKIESYTKKKNVSCEGKVTVTNINNEDYRYAGVLDCGKEYNTKTLVDYIDENVEVVTESDGLYNLNNELVYRGDNVNNYLKLNNNIYRIVKIKDSHPVVILTENLDSHEWDDRYNIETKNNSGINEYEISRIKSYLDNIYSDTSEDALLSKDAKLLVSSYDVPIGRRNKNDTDKSGKLENAVTLTGQYIGLLPVSDFLNASLDVNCTKTTSQSCENYNYLNRFKHTWWTATADSENTYKAYTISNRPKSTQTSSYAYVRPVLHLVKDTIYVSGDGSKNNPFIIK